MVDQTYIKNDLEDYVPEQTLIPEQEYGGPSRTDVIRALLPVDADVEVYSTGGWQGTMGFVIELDDYVWLIKEAYGSCSVCDGFLATDDRMEYGRSILRNAYCFEDRDDAIQFVKEMASEEEWIWGKIEKGMLDILREDE